MSYNKGSFTAFNFFTESIGLSSLSQQPGAGRTGRHSRRGERIWTDNIRATEAITVWKSLGPELLSINSHSGGTSTGTVHYYQNLKINSATCS